MVGTIVYKKLLSDSAIYGLGAILIKSLAFFTLPIYTRLFSPEQYGVIEMLATLSAIFSIFMTMGLDSAQSYYFMEAKNKKTYKIEQITTSILQLRLILSVIVVILASVFSYTIVKFTFDVSVPNVYIIYIVLSTLFGTLVSQSLEIFRLTYKAWYYIGLSFLQTILTIGIILYFVYILNTGIDGYLIGGLIGNFFAMLMTLAVETFRKAWWPIAMDMIHDDKGPEFFRKVSLWYIIGGTAGAMLLTIISPYLVEYLTTEEYIDSWKIVGILCWGSVFYGFYLLSGLGMFYSKKTYLSIYVYGSGAILNIGLNYFLIPVLGLFGAAFATILSLLFANIIGMFISHKYYKVDWHWLYMGVSIFIGITFILYYIGEL